MFTRLLVPLDGTIEAAAALPAAETLARATGGSITLVRVLASVGDPAEASLGDHIAEDELRVTAEKLATRGLRVDWEVPPPPVAPAIIGAATSRDSDLIVMATHGRTGLARAFAGSVSERVVAESGRPVLLVKPGGKRLEHIRTLLVPVDGSADGAVGLGAAVGLARVTGARLVLLDILVPTPPWRYGSIEFGPATYIDPAWEEEERLRRAEQYLEELTGRLAKAGLQVESRALTGEVAPSIHALADEADADMVVMSTHARTGPARAVLGSVADAVVRTSHRPVLLVRRPGGALDGMEDTANPAALVASSTQAA